MHLCKSCVMQSKHRRIQQNKACCPPLYSTNPQQAFFVMSSPCLLYPLRHYCSRCSIHLDTKRVVLSTTGAPLFSYRQEVNGLSRAFFEGFTQQSFGQQCFASPTVPQKDSNVDAASTLRVPRHLWEGKSAF